MNNCNHFLKPVVSYVSVRRLYFKLYIIILNKQKMNSYIFGLKSDLPVVTWRVMNYLREILNTNVSQMQIYLV